MQTQKAQEGHSELQDPHLLLTTEATLLTAHPTDQAGSGLRASPLLVFCPETSGDIRGTCSLTFLLNCPLLSKALLTIPLNSVHPAPRTLFCFPRGMWHLQTCYIMSLHCFLSVTPN